MAVDVLKQMRERLAQETLRRQALEASPDLQVAADGEDKVYAYAKPIPDDLWIKCPACNGVMFRDDFEKNLQVCTVCGHHYRLDSRQRLQQTRQGMAQMPLPRGHDHAER